MNRIKTVIYNPWGFAVVATLLSVLVLGGVALAMTPAGCGLGIHTPSCGTALVTGSPIPVTTSPGQTPITSSAPIASPSLGPRTSPIPSPTRSPTYAPYEYPASAPFPYVPGTYYASIAGRVPACWLPVQEAYGAYSAEFLELPSGSLIGDITTLPSVPQPPPGTAPQNGADDFGLSYDRAYRRWVPVKWSWVAPDGKHYAYAYPVGTGIVVVDVLSGSVLEIIGGGQTWSLIDVETDSVYAVVPSTPGLWRLPFSGAPVQVTSTGYWYAVGGGAAYGDIDTNGLSPGNIVQRVELGSGSISPWFQAEGAVSTVVGFDHSGAPIIESGGPDQILWLVPAMGHAQPIMVRDPFLSWGSPAPIGDRNGIWFAADQAIFAFVPGQGTFMVSGTNGAVVGGCGQPPPK